MNVKNNLCLFVLVLFFVKCASLKKDENKEASRLPPPNVIIPPPSGPLQIQKLSMGNLLSWTPFEADVQYYEVEKSVYGTNFESIGKVEAMTENDAEKAYRFFDTQLGIQKNYYRLKVVKTDGITSFSQTTFVNKQKKNQFSVVAYSSVMTNKQFNLTLYSLGEGQLEFALLSNKGAQIYERYQWAYPGLNEVQVSLADVPAGTYQVKLKFKEKAEEEFLTIQKISDSKSNASNTISKGHYSAFSPNGDGHNDSLIIYGLENALPTEVMIFNKQGKEVFHATNYKNEAAWNGQLIPAGLYYCIINRANEKELTSTYISIEK